MSGSRPLTIFFTGATGYIGGTVLSHLLHSDIGQRAHINALIRPTAQNAAVIGQLTQNHSNVAVIEGSHQDAELVTEQAAAADIVIHTANSADDLPSIKAIVAGLSQPLPAGRPKRFLLHTSGTGELVDFAKGQYAAPDSAIYSDLDFERFDSLPPSTYHRNCTQVVFDGARQHRDAFAAAVIAPPLIYGPGSGYGKKFSQQIPLVIAGTLAAKQGSVVGNGSPIWQSVHVADLAELYVAIVRGWLEHRVSTVAEGGGLYYAATGEFSWLDISKAVAAELHKRGLLSSPAVTHQFTEAEMTALGGEELVYGGIGSNSRCKSERAEKEGLGWHPKHIDQVLSTVEYDVTEVLNAQKQQSGQ